MIGHRDSVKIQSFFFFFKDFKFQNSTKVEVTEETIFVGVTIYLLMLGNLCKQIMFKPKFSGNKLCLNQSYTK